MTDEMKPVKCGCGGEAEVIKHTFHGASPSYGVECTNCHAESWQFYNTEAEAVMAWNRAMSENVQECAENARCDERTAMVWKPAKGRPVYEKGICSCGYVLSVLQRDFVYCPMCGARLEWNE